VDAGVLVARVAKDVEMTVSNRLERLLRAGAAAGAGAEPGEGVPAGGRGQDKRDGGDEPSRGDRSRDAGQDRARWTGEQDANGEQGRVQRRRRG